MTLVVAVLTADFVAVLADTKNTLVGPAVVQASIVQFPTGRFRVEGGNLVCDQGESITCLSRSAHFWKVRFSSDLTEGFSFAGSRESTEPYLGLSGTERLLAADEAIWQHFSTSSKVETGPIVAPGEYPSMAGMHVYEVHERLVATTFEASVLKLSRQCQRSSQQEVRYAAIGSGAHKVEELLTLGEYAAEWSAIVGAPKVQADVLYAFWSKVFCVVSHHVEDVGPEMFAWLKRQGQPFTVVGWFTRDVAHARRLAAEAV